MLKYTLTFLVFVLGVYAEERPFVKIPNGLIRGTYKTSIKGRHFTAFEGIPYARPPVGDLRFAEPQPALPWTGVWNANNTYECMQINHDVKNSGLVQGEEDCLYLNIYSPRINDVELLDVIVHIHGGAFMFGHSTLYGPDFIMDRDVVYVNINYRLGPLGFLSTEDEVVPGNNGLKDQSMALKWIKENIEYFGGNSESITITGLSAGGASVHYHYLSPLSKGLFTRGISMSGNSLCNWALVEKPLEKTRALAFIVGCESKSNKELVECLKRRPAKQIVQTVKSFQPWLYNPYSPFGPVVELAGPNKFLPDLPYNLLKQGKVYDVPWITSTTTSEGLYPAADFIYTEDRLPYLEKHWLELAPYILHYDGTVEPNELKEVSQKIKDYYLKGKPISRDTFPELVQAIGDRLFVVASEKAARLQAQVNKSPVYYYRFDYRGDHSISEIYSHQDENFGVSHGDDLMYVLSGSKSWFKKYLVSSDDKKLSDILLDMWKSYANTGIPKIQGVKWEPLSTKPEKQIRYLHIASSDSMAMEKADQLGNRLFWDSLSIREDDNIITVKDEL